MVERPISTGQPTWLDAPRVLAQIEIDHWFENPIQVI